MLRYLGIARHFSVEAARAGTSTARPSGGGGDTLGRRLLSLVYPKRSAVVAINKWKEEHHALPGKYQFNRIVRELRKIKRYKHALEVCSVPAFSHLHLRLIAKSLLHNIDIIVASVKELRFSVILIHQSRLLFRI